MNLKQGLKARLFISPGHRPGGKRIEKVALKVQHNLQYCTFSAVLNSTDNTQGDALGYQEDGLSALRLLAKLKLQKKSGNIGLYSNASPIHILQFYR